MKLPRTLVLCLSLLIVDSRDAFAADAAGDFTPAPSERALPVTAIPDRYIVQVVDGVDVRSVAASHGVSPNFVYQHAVRGFAGIIPPGRLAGLRSDSRVLRVTPDRKVTAIGKPGGGGGGGSGGGQLVPEGVKRIHAAPGDIVFTGAGVGVAVIDTGVDLNHRDLATVRDGFNAFGGSAQDNNGHGTHVAGIIAARHNAQDVVGVAPDATIYAVKVLDASGNGSDAAVIAGLDWVANATSANPPIRVVNMSLGREGSIDDNTTMRNSISKLRDLGITVVVAAGNDPLLEISRQVPAGYPEVLAIASTTAKDGTNLYKSFKGFIKTDTASYFTSDGMGVAISAPGEDQENITKAGFIQSVGILSTKLGGGTTRMSGTSMAAPHAAGVAALVYEKWKTASKDTPEAVRGLIGGSASNDSAPLASPTSSYTPDGKFEGVLDARATLSTNP